MVGNNGNAGHHYTAAGSFGQSKSAKQTETCKIKVDTNQNNWAYNKQSEKSSSARASVRRQ